MSFHPVPQHDEYSYTLIGPRRVIVDRRDETYPSHRGIQRNSWQLRGPRARRRRGFPRVARFHGYPLDPMALGRHPHAKQLGEGRNSRGGIPCHPGFGITRFSLVEGSIPLDLFGGEGCRFHIESAPSSLAIGCSPDCRIDRPSAGEN